MANLFKHDETLTVLSLSRAEAANLIAHLAAQLGDTNLPNNYTGACYTVRIDNTRLTFAIKL